jgi:hypothetical protein
VRSNEMTLQKHRVNVAIERWPFPFPRFRSPFSMSPPHKWAPRSGSLRTKLAEAIIHPIIVNEQDRSPGQCKHSSATHNSNVDQ